MSTPLSLLVVLLCVLLASPAHAACTSPAGNETDMIYNNDFHTYQFCNGTTWMTMGAIGSTGGLFLISTQTASSSASLQFSGSNWSSSYNTLFLNCSGIRMSASGNAFYFRVGEGAGPTWESGATYAVYSQSNTGIDIFNGPPPQGAGATVSFQLRAYIDSVSSSTIYKPITWLLAESDAYNGQGNGGGGWNMSWWRGDTNPVTGIELVATAGTISSGTCSLYGMN